jgi:hypothetical protein
MNRNSCVWCDGCNEFQWICVIGDISIIKIIVLTKSTILAIIETKIFALNVWRSAELIIPND